MASGSLLRMVLSGRIADAIWSGDLSLGARLESRYSDLELRGQISFLAADFHWLRPCSARHLVETCGSGEAVMILDTPFMSRRTVF